MAPGHSQVYPDCTASRAVGKEAYHTATTAPCQLRFDSATIRKAALEMRYDGVALKMSPFIIYLKAQWAERFQVT